MTKERGTRSQVVAGATRADRVRARDLLGPLGSLRVAGITRGRYCRAYRNFAWYMYVCGWVLRFLDEVDVALSAYVRKPTKQPQPCSTMCQIFDATFLSRGR